MDKRKYCTYCVDFNRELYGRDWGRDNSVAEVTGCAECQDCHMQDVNTLKAKWKSLQLDLDHEITYHETHMAGLEEKSRLDFLTQKAEYEQLIAKLDLELNKLKACHIRDAETLKAELKSLQLDFDHEITSHETHTAGLKERHRLDLLNQKEEYQTWIAKLTLELNNLKACHMRDVNTLKAESKSLQLDIDKSHETHMAGLEEKSRLDYLHQKAEYEQLIEKLTVELNNLKACHMRDVNTLKAELKSMQLDLHTSHEIHIAGLLEKSRLDLLNQKAEYEQLIETLTLDLNNLKADNNGNLSKIEFLKIRRDCNQADVFISLSDSRIFAHRAILAGRSPVFQKFLQSESLETQTPVINLECLSPPVLEAVVDFCYSGEIAFSDFVPPVEVFKLAQTFQLGLLSDLTETELCRGLNVDNVPKMLQLARDYSSLRLQEEAGKLFKEHFDVLFNEVCEVLRGPHTSSSKRGDSAAQERILHDSGSVTHRMKEGKSSQQANSPSHMKENYLEGDFRDENSPRKSPRTVGHTIRSPKVPLGSQSRHIEDVPNPQQPVSSPTQSPVGLQRFPLHNPETEQILRTNKCAPISSPEPDSEEEVISLSKPDSDEDVVVPTPEFHHFDNNRTETDITPGQIWAIYDDQDGMPRFYGHVCRVSTKPFRAQLSWLEHSALSDKESSWMESTGLSIACGEFKLGKTTVMDQTKSFSHVVREKAKLEIYPMKGQIWAIYRDWDAEQRIGSTRVARTNEESPYTFDVVEILVEFSKIFCLKAAVLLKIPGFKTVYSRQESLEAVRSFKPTELVKFSHFVPNQRIDDVKADACGIPRGALELDPAATPLDLIMSP